MNPTAAQDNARLKVAVLDKHALHREALAEALAARSTINICWSGDSVVDYAESPRASDVVLLSELAATGGTELAATKTLLDGGAKILLLMEHHRSRTVEKLVASGAAGVVGKSESLANLIAAITTVASGRLWTSPEFAAALLSSTSKPLLTDRQQAVLDRYVAGESLAMIARDLGMSVHTVKYHLRVVRNVFSGHGYEAVTPIQLSRVARELGLLAADV